jgi:hypothetical protein
MMMVMNVERQQRISTSLDVINQDISETWVVPLVKRN